MSVSAFLTLLQSLITMGTDDPEDANSYYACNVLKNLIFLLRTNPTSSQTLRLAEMALNIYPGLVYNRSSFAGIPGDRVGNKRKQQALLNALQPHC